MSKSRQKIPTIRYSVRVSNRVIFGALDHLTLETMKTAQLLLLSLTLAASCSKKDDSVPVTPSGNSVSVATNIVKTWKLNNSIIRTDQGDITLTAAQQTSTGVALGPSSYTFTADGKYSSATESGMYKLLEGDTKLSMTTTATQLFPSSTTTVNIQLPSTTSMQLSSNTVAVNPLSSSVSTDDQVAAGAGLSLLKTLGKDPNTYKSIRLITNYDGQ